MLSDLCAELRNYFLGDEPQRQIHTGNFTIKNGSIAPIGFLKEGQYFRIVGSALNDGVYQHPAAWLTDETFAGAVWAMSVPPSIIALADEIKDYCESDAAKPVAYVSESFGGYSYTRATGADGAAPTWQAVFAKRLNPYRRMRVL